MTEIHLCFANHAGPGKNSLIDLVDWLWAALDAAGIRMSTSDTEFRDDVPNIVFELDNHTLRSKLDRHGGRVRLICFVTEVIADGTFDDGPGFWDGRSRYASFMSLADRYAGFITTVPSNVAALRKIAPATFFELGYAEKLVRLQPVETWKYPYSFCGNMNDHRAKFFERVARQLPVYVPGGPYKRHSSCAISDDDYLRTMSLTAVNIGLKLHPSWPLPSPTRLARAAHFGTGCVYEKTAETTRQSRLFPTFESADDFLARFSEVDPAAIRREALERLAVMKAEIPIDREIRRNIDECPVIAGR